MARTGSHTPIGSSPGADGESRLLALLRAGDEAASERFVREHTGRMLAVARRFLPNEEDAQDAVQEAFLSAFRALPGFEGGSRLSTWLHRITVNACLMKLRTRRRKPERLIEDLLPRFQSDGHRELPAAPWAGPEESALEREETRATIRSAIEELPENYRTVLLMRDIEGLDTLETARMLGESESAVKTRLHRARQALRESLAPVFEAGSITTGAFTPGHRGGKA